MPYSLNESHEENLVEDALTATADSAKEEAYVEQQLSELRPNAALAPEIGGLLEMLIFFGHVQQAQKLQTQLASFESACSVCWGFTLVSPAAGLGLGFFTRMWLFLQSMGEIRSAFRSVRRVDS
ncbi:hypothetical protein F444_04209 [Phytophthora nicotianae P1976]|uniref:Uncharacterized protein n=1 Tax=Phytophthora nicotianae P1976 TaxID=1317066 RepID=A0A081ARI4_PHYNI|nr:hypothetical protein F444_04209 [Phytophthora nicotianae P1976]